MLILAAPLLAASLVGGVTFQLVDLKFITSLGDESATAVIVTNQSLRQILIMLVLGASFGAQGLVSRQVGEGRIDAAEHTAGQLVLLGFGLSVLFAVAGVTFAEPLLRAMKVSPAVLAVGLPYVRLIFLFNFGFVFLILFSAILNGAGDTTTPLLITVAQTCLSLLAEWCLIFGHLGAPVLGIEGVAMGLVVGQTAALALAFRVLVRGESRVHLRRRHFIPDWTLMRHITALSWPPALQMISNFLVTVFFIRLMGELGDKAQTAYSIGLRLGMVGPMLSFPVAGACSILVGQSLGSGNRSRAWRSLGTGILLHSALLWGIAVALALFRREVVGFFTSDPEVLRIGSELLLFQAGAYGVLAFYFVFFRALQAAGDMTTPMLISLGSSLLVTLPLGVWLAIRLGWGPTGIFTAGLIGAIVVTTLTGLWVATGRWTRRRAGPSPPPFSG